MQINNMLVSESFQYTTDKTDMLARMNEIMDFAEIVSYCLEVEEKVIYNDDVLWSVYVEEEINFVDWLYSGLGKGREEDRRLFLELISKQELISYEKSVSNENDIYIALGEYENAVSSKSEYVSERRNILAGIRDVMEYEQFMHSCFLNSHFADNILDEMRYIKNFSDYTEEITKCLSILNDEAIELYEEYHDDLKTAMAILQSKLRKCSPDSKNAKFLKYPFKYYEQIDGKNIARIKMIECSPHLKLIREDSNLRIYFSWKDTEIDNGEKVLVGRIGRHPY